MQDIHKAAFSDLELMLEKRRGQLHDLQAHGHTWRHMELMRNIQKRIAEIAGEMRKREEKGQQE